MTGGKGKPQTINLIYAPVGGRQVRAPLEVWIAAIIDSLDSRSKQIVLEKVERMAVQRAIQVAPKIISDLSMPA